MNKPTIQPQVPPQQMGNSFPQPNMYPPVNYAPNYYPVYNQPYNPYTQQPNMNQYYNPQVPYNQPYNYPPYGQGMSGSMGPRGGGWGRKF